MNKRRKCTRKRVGRLWDSVKRAANQDQSMILAYLVGWCGSETVFADGLEGALALVVREVRFRDQEVTDSWLDELYKLEDRRER